MLLCFNLIQQFSCRVLSNEGWRWTFRNTWRIKHNPVNESSLFYLLLSHFGMGMPEARLKMLRRCKFIIFRRRLSSLKFEVDFLAESSCRSWQKGQSPAPSPLLFNVHFNCFVPYVVRPIYFLLQQRSQLSTLEKTLDYTSYHQSILWNAICYINLDLWYGKNQEERCAEGPRSHIKIPEPFLW